MAVRFTLYIYYKLYKVCNKYKVRNINVYFNHPEMNFANFAFDTSTLKTLEYLKF